jgi:hypothetical protein
MLKPAASFWERTQDGHELRANGASSRKSLGLPSAGRCGAGCPRDVEMPPLKSVPGRINRNFRNYMETFPFFVAAVLAAQAAGIHNELTHWGSIAYIGGRIAYTVLIYPEYRSSARCSGTSPPLACLRFWRRPSCRAKASGGKSLRAHGGLSAGAKPVRFRRVGRCRIGLSRCSCLGTTQSGYHDRRTSAHGAKRLPAGCLITSAPTCQGP